MPDQRVARFFCATNLVLVLFSSTHMAGEASEYAFKFYRALLSLNGGSTDSLLHLLAAKAIHLTLFLSLGIWGYLSLSFSSVRRLAWAAGICFLVGCASEGIQFYTARHPSLADLALNLSSGALGAVFASRDQSAIEREIVS